jgi:hypothetical protein
MVGFSQGTQGLGRRIRSEVMEKLHKNFWSLLKVRSRKARSHPIMSFGFTFLIRFSL